MMFDDKEENSIIMDTGLIASLTGLADLWNIKGLFLFLALIVNLMFSYAMLNVVGNGLTRNQLNMHNRIDIEVAGNGWLLASQHGNTHWKLIAKQDLTSYVRGKTVVVHMVTDVKNNYGVLFPMAIQSIIQAGAKQVFLGTVEEEHNHD